MNLTTVAHEMYHLKDELARHEAAAKAEADRLRAEINSRAKVLSLASEGLDHEKIALAHKVIEVRGSFERGGDDRSSVIQDAIRQLATGKPGDGYLDLWRQYFGTKSYDRWHGQRSDHPYFYGPSHGSIIFSVGLTELVRKRDPRQLTPEETEAAIYLLVNLARIQAAERAAA